MTQGPNSAKQKRLYYVYGKGLHNAPSQGLIKNTETRPQGQGYAWPAVFKQPGHLYFDMTFIEQGGNITIFQTLSLYEINV